MKTIKNTLVLTCFFAVLAMMNSACTNFGSHNSNPTLPENEDIGGGGGDTGGSGGDTGGSGGDTGGSGGDTGGSGGDTGGSGSDTGGSGGDTGRGGGNTGRGGGDVGKVSICETGFSWKGIAEVGTEQIAYRKGSIYLDIATAGRNVYIYVHTDPITSFPLGVPCREADLVGTLKCDTSEFTARGTWDDLYGNDDGHPVVIQGSLEELEGTITFWNCSIPIKWKPANLADLENAWASCQ